MHITVHKNGRDWNLQINLTLWVYTTSIHTPTGATPFALTYGVEVIILLEVEIPSLRVSLKGLVTDEDYYAMRLQEL